jgi:two-component system NtrC family sensor kinase
MRNNSPLASPRRTRSRSRRSRSIVPTEALRWLEEQPWDLLILDLRMPEIDGPTLYREMLARWPAAASHVLFVSGVAELPRHDDTVKALNVPVLFKPFTLDALRAEVARVLATI